MDPGSISAQAEAFAGNLMGMLAEVLPSGDLGFNLTSNADGSLFTLATDDPRGLALEIEAETVLRLEVGFRLAKSSRSEWMRVTWSRFSVVPEGSGAPFFRYDYDTALTGVPRAHLNVHGHRDDLIQALLHGKSARAKARRRNFLKQGALPTLASIHFPLGGFRFRPCLEDVLETVIAEFGLDVRADTYRRALTKGRERYRRLQLEATIRECPGPAIEALKELGYHISEPAHTVAPRLEALQLI